MTKLQELSKDLFESSLLCRNEQEIYKNLIVKYGLDKRKGEIDGVAYEWEYFGRNENNLANVTANTDTAILALVEKLVNSTDAMLLKFCRDANIEPCGADAPQSVAAAVEKFVGIPEGDYSKTELKDRKKIPEAISVILENKDAKKNSADPTISVADSGCGISHADMESTILNDGESNKSKVPFLSGKYSRGGLAVLNFLGDRGIQTILSKACPSSSPPEGEHGEDWSFTITQKLQPSELSKYGFGQGFKNGAVVYLKLGGVVPHFQEKEIKIKGANKRKKALRTLKYGTWIRMFDFQINEKLTKVGNLSMTNAKDIMKLGAILRACMPEVAYPIHCHQPNNTSCAENKPSTLFGLLPYLQDPKHHKGTGRNKKLSRPPETITLDTPHGVATVKVFLLEPKKENFRFAGGVRGAYWQIDNQWQNIDSRATVDSTWGMGSLARDHMIITVNLTNLSTDLKSQVADVSREKLRGNKVFQPVRDEIIKAVNNLESVKAFKDHLKVSNVEKSTREGKSAIAKFFDRLAKPQRATKQSKLKDGICVDSGDLVGICDKGNVTSPSLKDIITEAHLIDAKFKDQYVFETDSVVRRKEVNRNTPKFRIQIGTDANMSFWENYSIGFECSLAELEKDNWTSMEFCDFNPSPHGILTFTLCKEPRFNSMESFLGRIKLFPKDESVCEHPSFEFTFECQNVQQVRSPSSSSSKNRSKNNNKSSIAEISFHRIKGDTARSYKIHSDPKNPDNNIYMAEDDLIGFDDSGEIREYVLNTDAPSYKKTQKETIKRLALPSSVADTVEHNHFDFYYSKVKNFEKSSQDKEALPSESSFCVNTSGFSCIAESDGMTFGHIFSSAQAHEKKT